MDAFYASVEQRDFPALKGKPVVVGGSPDGRGVVATASYEAREYGIKSAMSAKVAVRLCPYAVFVKPRFEVYQQVSRAIREIFQRYTDLIEPLSLDEAYLDVTEDKMGIGSAIDIAREIKNAIREELNLTASAGVSVNKFIAKIASDMDKPDGLTFIGPSRIERFMEQLPVSKFFGVGKVTAEKMKKQHLLTGADLKKLSEERLVQLFGKSGKFYYRMVRGIDHRPVVPHREIKSISVEDTFPEDLEKEEELFEKLKYLSGLLHQRLLKKQLYGRTLTLKVKFSDFKQLTKSLSKNHVYRAPEEILATAYQLLKEMNTADRKIRLMGIGCANFEWPDMSSSSDVYQPTLFS